MAEREQELNDFEESLQTMKSNIKDLKDNPPIGDISDDFDDLDTDDEPAPQLTATEQAAMEKGWSPDKDSLPEGKEWISAGEFLRNERLYDEIRRLKRDSKQTRQDFELLKEHHRKVEIATKEKLLTQLKEQKKIALADDDHDAVVEIDEQILDIKSKGTDTEAVEVQQKQQQEVFEQWVDKNRWYEENDDMRETADDLAFSYFTRKNGKVSQEEVYSHVVNRIKKLYPEVFTTTTTTTEAPKRQKVAAVESASTTRTVATAQKKSKFTERDLSPDQRKAMNRFVRQGVLTKAEYIQQLVTIGELG